MTIHRNRAYVSNFLSRLGLNEKDTKGIIDICQGLSLNVSITNMLIKPEYWDKNFIDWFGEYSKVKHEKFIEMAGHDFPLTYEEAVYWNSDKINLAYWQFAGRKLADYFVKNPTKDEHGNLIDPWEPA